MSNDVNLKAHHLPVRPGWSCTCCEEAWPCAARRSQLVEERRTNRMTVAAVMAGHLRTAVEDLPDVPVGELYERFLGWLR